MEDQGATTRAPLGGRIYWAGLAGLVVLILLVGTFVAGRHATKPAPELRGREGVDIEKLQAATKSLDAAAQSMKGKTVLSADALEAYLPATVGDLARVSLSREQPEGDDLSGPTVRADYAGSGQSISLSVTDLGAAGALAALAGAFNVESGGERDGRIEKVAKVDGRMTAESWEPAARKAEYSVMVADRFMVHAQAQGLSMEAVRKAAALVDYDKLQAAAR